MGDELNNYIRFYVDYKANIIISMDYKFDSLELESLYEDYGDGESGYTNFYKTSDSVYSDLFVSSKFIDNKEEYLNFIYCINNDIPLLNSYNIITRNSTNKICSLTENSYIVKLFNLELEVGVNKTVAVSANNRIIKITDKEDNGIIEKWIIDSKGYIVETIRYGVIIECHAFNREGKLILDILDEYNKIENDNTDNIFILDRFRKEFIKFDPVVFLNKNIKFHDEVTKLKADNIIMITRYYNE